MPRVFISAPSDERLSGAQRTLKEALISILIDARLQPEITGRRGLSAKGPYTFEQANDRIGRCQAAVVLAIAARRATFAYNEPEDKLASEFCHFEGGLAIAHGLPTLIVTEEWIPSRGIGYRYGGRHVAMLPAEASPSILNTPAFGLPFAEWLNEVQQRRDVFIGYSTKARSIAERVTAYLQSDLKVSVMDWAVDFDPGASILERLREAAERCHSGIFIFSRDDRLADGAAAAAPRDNVVFEAGYFMNSKGPRRVLIVLERGAKMPADVGGNIYADLIDRENIDSIRVSLGKFCVAALERPIRGRSAKRKSTKSVSSKNTKRRPRAQKSRKRF
jgi:predicted nucleotide-binding protein with TIR-like domain